MYWTIALMDRVFDIAAYVLIVQATVLLVLRWPYKTVRSFAFCILLAGIGATLLWLRSGSGIELPRSYVVVFSEDLEERELKAVLSEIGNAPVSFVYLTQNAPEPSSSLLRSGKATMVYDLEAFLEDPSPILPRVVASSAVVNSGSKAWPSALSSACRDALDGTLPFRKRTILFVYDPGATWRSAPTDQLDTGGMVHEIVSAAGADAFLYSTDASQTSGNVDILLSHESIPTVNDIRDLLSESFTVRLSRLPPSIDATNISVNATLYVPIANVDSPNDYWKFVLLNSRTGFEPSEGISDSFETTVRFKDFSNETNSDSHRLDAGLAYLEVTLKTKTLKGDLLASYIKATYVRIRNERMVIIAPEKNSEKSRHLTRVSWERWVARSNFTRYPENLKSLINWYNSSIFVPPTRSSKLVPEFFSINEKRIGSDEKLKIDTAKDEGIEDRDNNADIRQSVANARALVLVEPTAEELIYLDALLELPEAINAGLNVLVAGPPLNPEPRESLPDWLPARAKGHRNGKLDEPMYVFRDRRLYFVFSDAQAHGIPLTQDNSRSIDLQVAIANGLVRALGGEEDIASVKGRYIAPSKEVLHFPYRSNFSDAGSTPEYRLAALPVPSIRVKRNDQYLADYRSGNRELGYFRDLVTDHLGLRLQPMFQDAEGSHETIPYFPLKKGNLYPNSDVILFVSDFDGVSDDSIKANLEDVTSMFGKALELDGGEVPDMKNLTNLGVRVHLVELRLSGALKAYTGYLSQWGKSRKALLEAPKPDKANIDEALLTKGPFVFDSGKIEVANLGGSDVRAIVETLASNILPREPDRVTILDAGRSADLRIPGVAAAPEHHLVLVTKDEDWAPGGHTGLGARTMSVNDKTTSHRELALLTHAARGQGQVLVSAYSPFAADVWNADASYGSVETLSGGRSDWYLGWGIQRLIDLRQLSGSVRPLSKTRFEVNKAERAQDGSSMTLWCWGQLGGAALIQPKLRLSGANSIEFSTEDLDFSSQLAEFNLAPSDRLLGAYMLELGELQDDILPVYLDLQQTQSAGLDMRAKLVAIAELSGGYEVRGTAWPFPLHFQQSGHWLAMLLLSLFIILIFSPLGRPWTGFLRAISIWWRKGEEIGNAVEVEMDAQSFIVQYGLLLGNPRSGRIAGVPAGEKLYESGDRLSSARASTLFPFTAMAETVRIPKQLPKVRLRHVTQSFSVWIIVDNAPSLFVPEQSKNVCKASFTRFMAVVTATIMLERGATVTVSATHSTNENWGPTIGAGSQDSLIAYLEEIMVRPNSRLRRVLYLPDKIEDNQLVFIFSDWLLQPPERIGELIGKAMETNANLRIARVFDPEEIELVGVVRQTGSMRLSDRSEATADVLQRAYEAYGASIEETTSESGCRFADMRTDMTVAELAAELSETGWLES